MSLEYWIVGLALLGAADSLYTALQQRFPRLFEFCFTPGGKRVSCKEILHSKYARIFFLPNSWLGAVAYLLLAYVYYLAAELSVVGVDRIYITGAIIATLALVISYYLLYVQARILRKYCIFCLLSTTIITIITVLAWVLV